MDITKLNIFTATQKSDEEQTQLFRSIRDLGIKSTITCATDNREALSKVYNAAIDQALSNDADVLLLVHDDVTLEHDPTPKLQNLFEEYDLIGVAGTSRFEFKSPALWHLMGNRGSLHGAVAHTVGDKKHVTSFGLFPHRVILIDGVFMALNRKTMETVRFDENNPANFHHYDLIYSMDCHNAGLRVGVGDIYIEHSSPGLREYSKDWLAGEKYFFSKFAE